MDQRAPRQEAARRLDRRDDRTISITRLPVRTIDRAAGEERHAGQIDAVRPDRLGHREAVRLAEVPVIRAVAGRNVDEAGALIGLDEIRGQ